MKRRRMAPLSPPCASSPSSWRLAVTMALALLMSPSAATSYLHSGNGTAFFHSNISAAGCGFMSWPTLASTHYAAVLSSASSSNSAGTSASLCGRCARVWCDDDRCIARNDTNTLVYVVEDQYVDNQIRRGAAKDLNLAPSAFKTITGFSSGRAGIRWRFVDCPIDQPATGYEDTPTPSSICVKGGSSPYWLALQPVNDTLGIEEVRVNGTRAELKPSSPYFFTLSDPRGRLNLTKLEISITTRSRRRFKKVVAVQPGECVGVYTTDELPISDSSSSSSDGSGSTSPSPSPSSTTCNPSTSPAPSRSTVTPATTQPHSSTPQTTAIAPSISPSTGTPASTSGIPLVTIAAVTPTTSTQASTTQTPKPPSPVGPSSGGATSVKPSASIPQATPIADASTASSLSPPAFVPVPPASDAKETPAAASTATPITSKASDTPQDPKGSVPAVKAPDIPSEGSGPASLDKNGHPTSDPAAAAPGSQPSGVTTTRPLVSPSPPSDSGGSNNSQPPKPTPAVGPASKLTRGVLTSPLFIGFLLGSVGLIGAIVAYRAKSRQQHLLAMAPPVTSANATPRRAPYTSDPGLSAL